MTTKIRKLKSREKEIIRAEQGNKCGNPGCSNWRTHVHHIKHWSVYGSDDRSILIAVCPSCHDAIHHGNLQITDHELYRWKGIERPCRPTIGHVYVEPSSDLRLLVGAFCVATKNDEITVFKLSETNKLSFRALDHDIILVNLSISDLNDREVLKVADNHVRVHDDNLLEFLHVSGHIKIFTTHVNKFITEEFIDQIRTDDFTFLLNGELILLEMKVLKPGLIQIKGCWSDRESGILFSDKYTYFLETNKKRPSKIMGEGEETVLVMEGSNDIHFFDLRPKGSGRSGGL